MDGGLPSGVNELGLLARAHAFSDRLAPESVIGMDRNR
jgi:hypothetical protein